MWENIRPIIEAQRIETQQTLYKEFTSENPEKIFIKQLKKSKSKID
ncbi:MAG: hypothetical protein ISQ90_02935 [Rhodospirillales bacterium]|jgi:hypothetical protein|nr:hypothetical protein [Rhodospirillales bacterium]